MKITYINTGNSVGDETNYTASIVIPIAAGLKQELLFEEMTAVTNMQIGVYRNGALVHQQQLAPSSTMRIDLSTFAQVLPSLNELYKNLEISPSSSVQDKIQFVLLDGVAIRTYTFYVCSLNCPYLNSRGWVHHDERNLVSSASVSMVDVSLVDIGSGGTKELVTSSVRGTGTKIKGSSGWIANLPRSTMAIPSGVEITQSIYVENVGNSPFTLVARFATNTDAASRVDNIKIPVGFRGVVSSTRVMEENYAPYMFVISWNGLPMEANFHCFMVNYGSEPKPWIKAWAYDSSPCVGAMTDYRSGKSFNTKQIDRFDNIITDLDLTGFRRYSRIYYPVGRDHAMKTLAWAGGSGAINSGQSLNENENFMRIANPDGTTYGWYEKENKLPKDISPNCGVHLRWLNSRGWYDDMFFEKYSIKPVMRTNNNGGNGIDYYETTVQIDVNWDNEPCINWIQRSSDIIARIPIDICQFGRATLLATNVFQTQGGNKTKTIQFKFKVQIVEP
ncbi:hypothetical protein BD26P3_00008 [Phocaeicola phage BD26P3]|nr:hypothetical protein BD26P1_00029 [Phocaeicola phage BD26P1]WAX06061.1 hypothetical protein BD26P2_00014 [Phocaeicola phage BD26P2]WAX06104.1 hypothetical protein BD26P3_00008 [Phocaeicola phage BD26P3]WAX06158.1 hypothetical protein BD26P4_00014 [Phocaeicola phage BD26P4]WAX06201.1 hypothetical protein BD26P5_00008 [Phocaeicola phage BD26P5]